MLTSKQKTKLVLFGAMGLTALVLFLMPAPLRAQEATVVAEMLYAGPARTPAAAGSPDELEFQVRFTNRDNREVDGLEATVLVLEGRAVVARYAVETEAIPVGQSVTVSIFRSVVTSTSVEGRFRDEPTRFAVRPSIDQIDWSQTVGQEEEAPVR